MDQVDLLVEVLLVDQLDQIIHLQEELTLVVVVEVELELDLI
jgi:hypothetical protein